MNLVLLSEAERDGGDCGRARLSGERASHLIDVLGCEPGRHLRVGVADGPTGMGRVVHVDRARRIIELDYRLDEPIGPRASVDLILALPRPKVLARILEHVTALGVRRIVITRSWYVEKSYFHTRLLDPDGYRPHLLAGLEQAGDTQVPEVHVFRAFKPFVEDHLEALLGPGTRLVAHPTAEMSIAEAVRQPGRVAIAIGPERGWTDYEVAAFGRCGFRPVRLSARTVRVETACTAALAQLALLA